MPLPDYGEALRPSSQTDGKVGAKIIVIAKAVKGANMLDIKQELQKYLEPQALPKQSEISVALELFTQEAKRFGKEQYKTTSQLEELIIQMEEQSENNQKEQVLVQQLTAVSDEVKQLLQSLMSSSDCLEEVYRFAKKNADPSWQQQLSMQWKRLEQTLMFCGLMRIEGIGERYQSQTQVAVGVASNLTLPEGIVVEIIKSGYVYRGQVLRKAEVLVNKHQPKEAAVPLEQQVASRDEDFLLD